MSKYNKILKPIYVSATGILHDKNYTAQKLKTLEKLFLISNISFTSVKDNFKLYFQINFFNLNREAFEIYIMNTPVKYIR